MAATMSSISDLGGGEWHRHTMAAVKNGAVDLTLPQRLRKTSYDIASLVACLVSKQTNEQRVDPCNFHGLLNCEALHLLDAVE